jgi:phage terminase large subunit-like protein
MSNKNDVVINLAPFQDTFVASDERVVSIIAAKGAGKTFSGALYICREISEQPKSQGLVMFNTLQQARDIFAQDIEPRFQELNWNYNFNQQTLVCKVFDTLIHFRSAEPSALERIESVAYHWGWADEASYYSPEAIKTFFSRIRKGFARVRVTSMPDEPDHFMYSFLEGMEGKMFELSLKDNPDREFADRYEKFLRVTYTGAQLERYLSGKRVSLTGSGIFCVESHHRVRDAVYNPNHDVSVVWDFNVEYRAVSIWQDVGIAPDGNTITACVLSYRLNNATVYEDAQWLSDFFANHNALIYLNGDASGESRTAQTTDSMWKTIRDVFNAKLDNVRYITPKSNPPVKDTIQCVNWALRQGLVLFNQEEKNVYMSLSACRADKYGEIDKSMDYQANSTARSHEADTARYHVFHKYKHVYPGNRGGFFIV